MSLNFTEVLKSRKKTATERFETIKTEAQKTNDFGKADERFWYPERDKTGNAYAVIRFLDAPAGEDAPWVRYWSHGFKGPGGWYIENSLTTLNEDDPVTELNNKLWNSGLESNKDIARKQKRKLHYVSNIKVITDSKHPENEGKAFLFNYGKKIHDMIKNKMSPPEEFKDEVPCNPFDFWNGADFKLKIRKVDDQTNYDTSSFSEKSSALGTDEEIAEIWKQCHPLQPFLDKSNFKTYDELKARLQKVLNPGEGRTTPGVASNAKPAEVEADAPIDYSPKEVAEATAPTAPAADSTPDEDLDYFRNLAKSSIGEEGDEEVF